MKNNCVTQLAKISGKSKATVSRVLNNCPGVDSDMREELLARAEESQTFLPPTKQTDLAIILPDDPRFFWQKAQQTVLSAKTVSKKQLYVYSSTLRGKVLSAYLEQIRQSRASAVILAGLPDDGQIGLLAEFAANHFVLQLCEYTPIPNTFYIGSDPYADGNRLGKLLLRSEPQPEDCCVALLECKDSNNQVERNRGFSDAVKGKMAITWVEEPAATSLYPAQLARSLAEIRRPVSHLFAANGLTVPACDALRKIKGRHIRFIGFEAPPRAEEYIQSGRILAYAVQNMNEQIRLALQLSEAYLQTGMFPDRKFTYVPSAIHCVTDD